MKLKKILAAASASVLAIGTMAVSASANFYLPEGELDPSLIINTGDNGMWLIQLYNTGNPEENKPAVDRGLDVTKVASMTAYLEIVDGKASIEDYDPAVDGFGGSMIWSANGGEYGTSSADELFKKYNWPGSFNSWWGLPEKDDTYEGRQNGENTNTGTANWDEKLVLKYIRKFAYSLTVEIPDDYRWIPGAGCYQVGVQEWGNSEYLLVRVAAYVINDDDGNILLAFDELGNEIDETKLNKIIEDLSVPVVDDEGKLLGGDTPSDSTTDNAGENTSANEESTASTEGNNNSNNTTAITTDSSSSNPPSNSNVGLVIGIVAGIVVIGGGIGAVSVLRKK